ncbi:MAG: response regulator [Burkholderiales bacterium]
MEKIAVIEDDASVQRALAIRLTSHGYRVVTAQDVASAIAVIRAENPALLLVDVCIPGGDGFQVVERVRRMPKMAKIPVLFITASAMPGLRERAASLSAGFLEKPFESSVLIAAVRAALDFANPQPVFREFAQHTQL